MIHLDLINGCYEFLGAILLAFNVKRVLKDRKVAGVSWLPVMFFATWGLWNLVYYPSLDQWFSFTGGMCLVSVNMVYLYLLIKFGGWKT